MALNRLGASTALIVMAKAPQPGLAKTRLIPALGAAGAAALAARLLAHAVEEATASGVGPVHLFATPDPCDPHFTALAATHAVRLHAQGDGDLGARMQRAFDNVLATSARVLMIGTDAPALTRTRLQEAALALDVVDVVEVGNVDGATDAVFVPAHDGGYALIGLRRTATWLFDAMPWSTAEVMATTRARASAAGWRIAELAPVHDIDEASDLVHLPPSWAQAQ